MSTVRADAVTGMIRVLLIDDDDDVRALVETMIGVDGRFHLVASTDSATEGIRLAAWHQPDAVVLDLHIPGVDGLQALPVIRQVFGGVVVVFSAFPDPFTLLDVTERGADAYVDKARAWSELLPAVAAACEAVRERR